MGKVVLLDSSDIQTICEVGCGEGELLKILRQYFPKGTDLSVHSQSKLNAVAHQLNEQPRKTLGFQTPAECFNACVASIG